MKPKFDVFISYSRKDIEFADALVNALESVGLRIWIDRVGIESGAKWEAEIRRGLQNSRIVLLIISQASMDSQWVDREIGRAEKLGRDIIPIQIEALRTDTDYRMSLDEVNWIDAIKDQSPHKLAGMAAATRKKLDAMPLELIEPMPEIEEIEAPVIPIESADSSQKITSPSQFEVDVFISYSPLNQGFADVLFKSLKATNLRVWMDVDGIPGGVESEKALRNSRMMLLVVSGPAMRSETVKAEIEQVLKQNTPILRVEFADLKSGTIFPAPLEAAQSIDARRDTSPGKMDEIAQKAHAMLDALQPVSTEEDEAETAPEEQKESRFTNLVKAGVTGVKSIGSLVKDAIDGKPQPDVFMCYSRANAPLAEALYQSLRDAEFEVWMDPISLTGGSDWKKQSREALKNSRLMLLEISQTNLDSWTVRDEILLALKSDVPILPIQIEELKPNASYPLALNQMNWIDAKDQSQSKLEEIVAATRQKLNEKAPRKNGKGDGQGSDDEIDASALQKAMTFRGPKEGRIFAALRAGATDVGVRDRLDKTALHYAVGKQEMEIIRLLLERKADVNAQDKSGTTPLHLAVQDVTTTRLLMLNQGDFDVPNQAGYTPYDLAVEARATNTIYLMDLFRQVKEGSRDPNDALSEACGLNSWKAQRILNAIAAGATDMSICDAAGRTALHWAAQENEPELVMWLLQHGADSQVVDKAGNTPAKLARNKGHVEIGDLLFDYQADVAPGAENAVLVSPVETEENPVNAVGIEAANEALGAALAMKTGHKAKHIFQAVLDGATDLFTVDQLGRTALHWAVSKNNLPIVRLILRRGGEVDTRTSDQEMPLHYAAKDDLADIALALIEHGAPMEAKEKNDCTPLHLAAFCGAASVTRVLIEKGANVEAKNFLQETPLHCAMAGDCAEVAELLLEHGVNIEAVNDVRETSLHTAAYYDAVECARLLISRGANPAALNNQRATPLAIAMEYERPSIVRLLRKAGAK